MTDAGLQQLTLRIQALEIAARAVKVVAALGDVAQAILSGTKGSTALDSIAITFELGVDQLTIILGELDMMRIELEDRLPKPDD